MPTHSNYVGRFAPSPSGPLHMGSLVTALGSYLQARNNRGKWLLRIDDLDPPRVVDGAIEKIQHSLVAHGLHWDDSIVFQSRNSQLYTHTLTTLIDKGLTYRCDCSRHQIKQIGPFYTGTCRGKTRVSEPYAVRFFNRQPIDSFADTLLGRLEITPAAAKEDFVLKRRDGLMAYHLASVADDIQMDISEIVRGADLIMPTACQIAIFKGLDVKTPNFVHLPIVTFADGRKFSKQYHAPAIEDTSASGNLCNALKFLGFSLPKKLHTGSLQSILDWSLENWSLSSIDVKNIKQ